MGVGRWAAARIGDVGIGQRESAAALATEIERAAADADRCLLIGEDHRVTGCAAGDGGVVDVGGDAVADQSARGRAGEAAGRRFARLLGDGDAEPHISNQSRRLSVDADIGDATEG